MPVEHTTLSVVDQPDQDTQPVQVKQCAACQSSILVTVSPTYPDLAALCTRCRDPQSAATGRTLATPLDDRMRWADHDPASRLPAQHHSADIQASARLHLDGPVLDEDTVMGSPVSEAVPTPSSLLATPSNAPLVFPNKPVGLAVQSPMSSAALLPSYVQQHHVPAQSSSVAVRRPNLAVPSPDPLIDVTRLRVRSQTHHCLYPGATFKGTQKSGRNSYDVNVTIVDVDFASSFLCGYLRIRGLTDDWPELTTYFDAEIIGSRYGFLTQNWGANESEDLVHWSRFPAFKHVKHELKKPLLTVGDRDRGAVFMRWKERFLVPDHRVQDINGASFAGFYYVCVDFNPAPSIPSSTATPIPEEDIQPSSLPYASKFEPPQRSRRDSSTHRGGRSPSLDPYAAPPAATMSGFYFHQNSEPYQQLSLSHVPERNASSFEFR
ncbi:hypothetical protein HGRIS_012843 [Hohenbuehelia grisea]|uniref:Vacuolar import and degradation protein-domain-containing protein n=1 Tax=Hohenbuehelia grisea TaxID=104357 RepID=A0ABR3ITQ7_9AGAR